MASHASAAHRALEKAEAKLRASIAKTESDRNALKAAFEASVASYRAYRSAECRMHEIVARAGNGAGAIKLACEAELDARRTDNLNAAAAWLK